MGADHAGKNCHMTRKLKPDLCNTFLKTHNCQWFSWGRGTGEPWSPWPANITNKQNRFGEILSQKERGREIDLRHPRSQGQILTFTHKVYMNICIFYTYYFQNHRILPLNSLLAKILTGVHYHYSHVDKLPFCSEETYGEKLLSF